jgi:outer membrane protein assembly factor BamD (BamD/ComL family)
VPLGEVAVTLEAPAAATGAGQPSTAEALYAQAETCMRRGDDRCALARLSRLIARFAGSPQAATARYERARIVHETQGCSAAAGLLQSYLRRYPAGPFADAARQRLSGCAESDGPQR